MQLGATVPSSLPRRVGAITMANFAWNIFEALKISCCFIWGIIIGIFQFLIPSNPKSLRGEVILVTGGSNGIGREILIQLAKREKDVILISWDIDEAANFAIVNKIRSLGVKRAFAYTVDVTNADQIANTASKIRNEVGELTMIFNNAGILSAVGRCWEVDLKQAKKVFEVNVFAHWYILQEFLPQMIRRNKGHIIATCSISGFVWCPEWATYVSSKHAVKGYYESLKEDLRCLKPISDIKVSLAYPALVATNMTSPYKLDAASFFSLPSPIDPSEVASRIVEGILRNEEHIYIPSFWRLVHSLLSLLPPEANRRTVENLQFDPLGRSLSLKNKNG